MATLRNYVTSMRLIVSNLLLYSPWSSRSYKLEPTTDANDSATDALLWLKRAMEFIQVFLSEVSAGEHDLAVAAGKAYSRSLRQYPNWMARGLFALAVKAVPYHDQFIYLLGSHEEAVLEDIQQFSDSLQRLLTVIRKLYANQKLDK